MLLAPTSDAACWRLAAPAAPASPIDAALSPVGAVRGDQAVFARVATATDRAASLNLTSPPPPRHRAAQLHTKRMRWSTTGATLVSPTAGDARSAVPASPRSHAHHDATIRLPTPVHKQPNSSPHLATAPLRWRPRRRCSGAHPAAPANSAVPRRALMWLSVDVSMHSPSARLQRRRCLRSRASAASWRVAVPAAAYEKLCVAATAV